MLPVLKFLTNYGCHLYFLNIKYRTIPNETIKGSVHFYMINRLDQWFSPGTPASATTKSGHHDIAEILLKVAFKHQNSNSN
jgi:hypothetical protein